MRPYPASMVDSVEEPKIDVNSDESTGDLITKVFFNRLGNLLPSNTGLTVPETETDKVFKLNRKNIIRASKIGLFTSILRNSIQLLNDTIKTNNSLPIHDRTESQLRSIVVILRLLTDCAQSHWHTVEEESKKLYGTSTHHTPAELAKSYDSLSPLLQRQENLAASKASSNSDGQNAVLVESLLDYENELEYPNDDEDNDLDEEPTADDNFYFHYYGKEEAYYSFHPDDIDAHLVRQSVNLLLKFRTTTLVQNEVNRIGEFLKSPSNDSINTVSKGSNINYLNNPSGSDESRSNERATFTHFMPSIYDFSRKNTTSDAESFTSHDSTKSTSNSILSNSSNNNYNKKSNINNSDYPNNNNSRVNNKFSSSPTPSLKTSQPNPRFYHSRSSSTTSGGYIKYGFQCSLKTALIEEIDRNVCLLIRFLSAANWDEINSYLLEKLHVVCNVTASESEIIPNLDIFSMVYIDKISVFSAMKDLSKFYLKIKRPIHKFMILSFLAQSFMFGAHAHPDQLTMVEGEYPEISATASEIFDELCTQGDYSKPISCFWIYLSTLTLMLPSSFGEYVSTDPVARKNNNTKRYEFLERLKYELQHPDSAFHLIAIDCLLQIGAGASYISQIDASSPIVTYFMQLYPEMLRLIFVSPTEKLLREIPSVQSRLCRIIGLISKEHELKDIIPLLADESTSDETAYNIINGFPHVHAFFNGVTERRKLLLASHPWLKQLIIAKMPKLVAMESAGNMDTEEFQLICDTVVENINLVHVNMDLFLSAGLVGFGKDKFDKISPSIVAGMLSGNMKLAKASARFVTKLLSQTTSTRHEKSMKNLSLDDPVIAGYINVGVSAKAISQKLLSPEVTSEFREKFLLSILKTLLKARFKISRNYKFYDLTEGDISRIESASDRFAFSRAVETAILVMLSIPNMEISELALQCLKYLVNEASLTENFDAVSDYSYTIMYNYDVYSEFSSKSFVVTGPIALQKRYFKLLQQIQMPSVSITDAWDEIYNRWVSHGVKISELSKETSLSTHQISDWKKYSGCLSSVAGCFLRYNHHELANNKYLNDMIENTSRLLSAHLISKDKGSSEKYNAELKSVNDILHNRLSITREKVEKFYKRMIKLMIHSSTIIRETSKEILSMDTSFISYYLIFRELEHLVKENIRIDDSDDIARSRYDSNDIKHNNEMLLIADQLTTFTKLVIDRGGNEDLYVPVDIGALILTIAKYLQALPNEYNVVRCKIKMCSLCERIGEYKDTLNIRHEIKVRNKFTKILADWFQEMAFNDSISFLSNSNPMLSPVSYDNQLPSNNNHGQANYSGFVPMQIPLTISSNTSSSDRIYFSSRSSHSKIPYYELAAASIKALVKMLKGLIIDTSDSIHQKDIFYSKSIIFGSYTTMFLKVLEKFQQVEKQNSSDISALDLEKFEIIRQQTVLAMSNLLNANPDVGLQLALPHGLHADINIRLAFLEVFTNILNQGTQFSPEYNEAQKYENLTSFMVEHMSITIPICQNCPTNQVENLSYTLLNVFDSKKLSLKLVREVVINEIMMADSSTELLRRNSVQTRILSLYSKGIALEYLVDTLKPIITDFAENPDIYTFELNIERWAIPSVGSPPSEGETIKFRRALDRLIQGFQDSVDHAPIAFKIICKTIYDTTKINFPGAVDSALGAFVLLRFFCPAIVSPSSEKLLNSLPSKELSRSLLILARTIQYLANGSIESTKLLEYGGDGDYFERCREKILKFLRSLTVFENEDEKLDTSGTVLNFGVENIEKYDVINLHRFLYQNWEDIYQKITMDRKKRKLLVIPTRQAGHHDDNNSTKFESSLHGVKNRLQSLELEDVIYINNDAEEKEDAECRNLTSLISSLGKLPSEYKYQIPKILKNNDQSAYQLYDFMSRNGSRDITSVLESHVVNEGITQDGLPLLVITLRNFNPNLMDSELLVYRYFQVASRLWHNKFGIFCDCTGFEDCNTIPTSTVLHTQLLTPAEMSRNCAAIYYFNTNTMLLPKLKMWIRINSASTILNPKRIPYYFINSFSMGDTLNLAGLSLDKRSEKLLYDTVLTFSQVSRYDRNKRDSFPSSVNIGEEYLQIISLKPLYYISENPIYTNDCFHLSKVMSMEPTSLSGEPNEYTFEIKSQVSLIHRVTLISPKIHEIIRSIKSFKSRLSKDEEVTSKSVIRPEDVVANLLNIGLRNLCSSSSDMRLAAYNLLASMQTRFNLDFGRDLRISCSIGVPRQSISLATSISEAVSISHPQLTNEFLSDFFKTYMAVPEEKRHMIILYSYPWIKNVYNYVYLEEGEMGIDHTRRIIRRFLDFTQEFNNDYTYLLFNVWPVFFHENGLTSILVNEIVNGALYWETEGHNIENIVSLFNVYPTMGICGRVITRIREIIDVRVPHPQGVVAKFVDHPNWKELVILIRMTIYLVFESPLVSEQYLPDIFHIVSLLLNIGDYDFRLKLHKLFMNTAHSFSASEILTDDQKERLSDLLEEIAEPRVMLLFGLNPGSENTKDANSNISSLARVAYLENTANLMLSIIDTIGNVEEGNIWRSRWTGFNVRLAFNTHSIIQGRALVLMGCLAKTEVDDDMIVKILDVLAQSLYVKDDSLRIDLTVCIFSCLTKLVDGLSVHSKYSIRLFWLAIAYVAAFISNDIYICNIRFLEAVIRSLDRFGKFADCDMVDELLRGLADFRREWTILEDYTKIKFTKETFDIAVCSHLVKGICIPETRPHSLTAMYAFLEIRARNYLKVFGDFRGKRIFPPYLIYIFFLSLCSRSEKDSQDYLWLAGFLDDDADYHNKAELSSLLVNFCTAKDDLFSKIAFFQIAEFFNVTNDDEMMEERFLQCLILLEEKNRLIFFEIFNIVKDKVADLCVNTPNFEIMRNAYEVTIRALSGNEDCELCAESLKNSRSLLERLGLSGIVIPDINFPALATARAKRIDVYAPLLQRLAGTPYY